MMMEIEKKKSLKKKFTQSYLCRTISGNGEKQDKKSNKLNEKKETKKKELKYLTSFEHVILK